MSNLIESLNIIDDNNRIFEATLYRNGEIGLNQQDEDGTTAANYSLDEIRSIVATLGHLLWLADNHEASEG